MCTYRHVQQLFSYKVITKYLCGRKPLTDITYKPEKILNLVRFLETTKCKMWIGMRISTLVVFGLWIITFRPFPKTGKITDGAFRNLQFLNNVIIIKTNYILPQAYVTLSDCVLFCLGPLHLLLPRNFKLFNFSIFRFWASPDECDSTNSSYSLNLMSMFY